MSRIVVVGAGSGIGAAVAKHFHDRGDHVLAVDIRDQQTPASEYRQCDLRDAADIDALLADIGSGWDMLAHVAGIPGTAPAADVLKVNYLGMRLMAEGMLPLLREGGSIVTVASTAALGWDQRADVLAELLELSDGDAVAQWQQRQDPAYPVYTTSKQAAILYTKRLAGPAWSKYGVRVNTVSPGPVETPILTDFEQTMGQGRARHVPLHRRQARHGRRRRPGDRVPGFPRGPLDHRPGHSRRRRLHHFDDRWAPCPAGIVLL